MQDLTKEQLYTVLGILFVLLLGCIIGVYNRNYSPKQPSPESSPPSILLENKVKTENSAILVHVSGAVKRQGLYKMGKNDRLIDLLDLSGVLNSADLDSINLGEALSDGQRVFIPGKKGEIFNEQPLKSTVKGAAKAGKKININRADEKDVDSLPGIGPTMAKRIVEHRKEKGAFSNIEELKEVQGISEKKFDKLKDLITVN